MKKVLLVLIILVTILSIVSCTTPQEHQHTITGELFMVKEATCGDDGIAYMLCKDCGEIVDTISISKTNKHTEVILPAEEATCEKSGLTEGKYCSVCNNIIVEQKIIPITHTFGEWEIIEGATTTEDGLAKRCCTLCDAYETMVLPYMGSIGIEFTLNEDGESYAVTGIGTCADETIVIPSIHNGLTVTKIAFSEGIGGNIIKSIVIPESVTYIFDVSLGIEGFLDCSSLTSIEVDERNEYYKSIDGNLYSKDGNTLKLYVRGKKNTSFVIPESVTSIGALAFQDCQSLTSIFLPDSVTSIGDYAFRGCISLTSIDIPASLISIAGGAFEDCRSLTSIEVNENSENYKSIEGNLYTKDGKTLVQYAMGKIDTSFAIPDFVTSIGEYAFASCQSLTSIEIPDSVTSIGKAAFLCCDWITTVNIPKNITIINDETFVGCNFETIVIPDSVISIGNQAFGHCRSLTSITIPDSVTSIGDKAFENCHQLNSVNFGENSQLRSIGNEAFAWCYQLTSLAIPRLVSNVGEGIAAWSGTITCIDVDTNNEYYKSVDGNLYTKDGKTLVQYAIGKIDTSFAIPESVTSIGYYAFCSCDSLTSIVIPDSVTSIGERAFAWCDSLTIYCEAESKPYGWSDSWNFSNRPVVWGYKGE